MSTSVFKICRKSPRTFVIPLQSSRRLTFCVYPLFFYGNFVYAAVFALSPCPPRARHAHRVHRSQIVATISLFTVIRPTPFDTCPSIFTSDLNAGVVLQMSPPLHDLERLRTTMVDFIVIFNRGRSVVSWTLYG